MGREENSGEHSAGVSGRKRISLYETEENLAILRSLAHRHGVTVTNFLRMLIREEAARLGVAFPVPGTVLPATGEAREATDDEATPLRQRIAHERLREWVEQGRGGAELPHDAVQREVAILRAGARIAPARSTEDLGPGWADQLSKMVERVQAEVPAEWTEEELQEQIDEAIAEVRGSRAGHD